MYLAFMTKRRTRRARDEWSALVAEMTASGRSMSAYARDRGISLASLSYWKKKLGPKKADVSVAPKSKALFSEVVVIEFAPLRHGLK